MSDDVKALIDRAYVLTRDSEAGSHAERGRIIGDLADALVQAEHALESRLPTDDEREALARVIFLDGMEFRYQGGDAWETAAVDGNNYRREAFQIADALISAGYRRSVVEGVKNSPRNSAPVVGEYTHAVNLAEASRRLDEGGEAGLVDYLADLPTLAEMAPLVAVAEQFGVGDTGE